MRFQIDFTPTKRRPRIKRNGQSYDPKENQREKRAMVAAFKAQCGAVAPLEGAVSVKVDISTAECPRTALRRYSESATPTSQTRTT